MGIVVIPENKLLLTINDKENLDKLFRNFVVSFSVGTLVVVLFYTQSITAKSSCLKIKEMGIVVISENELFVSINDKENLDNSFRNFGGTF